MKAEPRERICENPRCDRGEHGKARRFMARNHLARYCCGLCGQQHRYDMKRAARLRAWGL